MAWVAVGVTGASIVGGMMGGRSARRAAETQARGQVEAARIAAEAARFVPVGVSGRYGSSQFGFDPSGRLSSASYNLTPEAKAQQDRLAAMANQGLGQYEQAFGQSQQLGQAGQQMFGLGQSYLGTSPQEQAQKYMAEQEALIAPGRAESLAELRNHLQQTGRAGLAVGGGDGMMASNPEMTAFYRADLEDRRKRAIAATQGGMDYAKFGQGMMTAGAGAYDQMYNMQQGAFNPYQTAQGGVSALEQQAQGMLNMGAELGGRSAQAGAAQGAFLQAGGQNAANSMFNANAYNPWGTALSSAGNIGMQYAMNQGRPNMFAGGGSGNWSAANNASSMFTS